MRAVLRDLRYAARSLRKSPGLALISIFALTLGIGLTTTMFSIVYGALMKGLPFDEPDQIVVVKRNKLAQNMQRMDVPISDLADYRAQQRSFDGLAAYYEGTVNVSGTEKAERYDGAFITSNTFRLLRVRPLLGRDFTDGEDQPGAPRVAILSYAMWQNRYGGNPAVIGSVIRVNGAPHTVIGVMPEKFTFPSRDEIWLPLGMSALTTKRGEGTWLSVVGRLKHGVSLDRANTDISAIAKRLQTEYKDTNDGIDATVVPFIEGDIGPQPRHLLYSMLGAVGFVLLIACANVANLLLDRAAHRTKEVGIRTALGASRMAVVRQFLAEALLLSGAGAVLGIGVAQLGITMFNRATVDQQFPFYIDIRLHPAVLLFAAIVAVAASLVSGAIPAYQSSRTDINEILKDESRGASSLHIGRLSKSLVMFEIALSCGLLVAAGLTIKSVTKLSHIDYGFTTDNIFTARLGFPSTYTDTAAQQQFFQQLSERLASLPGVRAAGLSSSLPGVGSSTANIAVEGVAYPADRDYPSAGSVIVTPGFFATFDIGLREGRAFTTQDRAETEPVAIVDERFVHDVFKGESPLGRRIRMGGAKSTAPWMRIVGVVSDTYSGDPEHLQQPTIYAPLAQHPTNFLSIAAHAAGAPMALTPSVRAAVSALNPDIPLYWVYSMDEALARPTWFFRVFGTIFIIFGFVALFLASVGLYAVMAFSVSRRSRELGIRMALGARRDHVVRMILRQGLVQLSIGMLVGLALAAGVAQVLQIILFDVQPRDPAIFGLVILVLTATALAACVMPALRATRVNPVIVLRGE